MKGCLKTGIQWFSTQKRFVEINDNVFAGSQGALVNFGKNRICLFGRDFGNEIHHMSFEFAVVQGEEHKGAQDQAA